MLEYLHGKRSGSKIAWANKKEGDRIVGGSEYRIRLWVMIHISSYLFIYILIYLVIFIAPS